MILVVGGAGYIGSHVNKALSAHGHETVVLDNLVYGHREFVKWGTFTLADLADIDSLRLVFKRYNIEAVMHFAAYAYVGESVLDPQKYYLNNLRNTLNLLQVMAEADVKHLVFSSTCATYGIPIKIPIDESHPQAPINPYGRSKLMVEHVLDDYSRAYGLKYVSLRYFNAAGADPDGDIGEQHNPETHLIPLVLNTILNKCSSVTIFGIDYDTPDGTCIRDYIHVTDLANAHLLALEYLRNGGRSGAFNLGNGNGFSVNAVIEKAVMITGEKIKVEIAGRREGDPPILVGSAEKAKAVLGWTPQYPDLEDILDTAWQWHKTASTK
ncbi:UDP-glucose 4-epimerase GalE [Geobacter sp. DSM 9736]|uniref:UDP-glucose 4-epimerase GalE n=1 Tax=Geobacter sp. DSM 9736 TaxID=1277350 RepID=UPI000B501832|nr:UDP-glucose 4-epimerase GalE [Geobacter sp. DSM 9736]SNB46632.1 UDP-galactose 4-epimerase [Geobacter sp. DSM 9736]